MIIKIIQGIKNEMQHRKIVRVCNREGCEAMSVFESDTGDTAVFECMYCGRRYSLSGGQDPDRLPDRDISVGTRTMRNVYLNVGHPFSPPVFVNPGIKNGHDDQPRWRDPNLCDRCGTYHEGACPEGLTTHV